MTVCGCGSDRDVESDVRRTRWVPDREVRDHNLNSPSCLMTVQAKSERFGQRVLLKSPPESGVPCISLSVAGVSLTRICRCMRDGIGRLDFVCTLHRHVFQEACGSWCNFKSRRDPPMYEPSQPSPKRLCGSVNVCAVQGEPAPCLPASSFELPPSCSHTSTRLRWENCTLADFRMREALQT